MTHLNLIHHENLSERQRTIVFEYYKLSSQEQLSHEDIYRLSAIWQMAESDLKLTQALSFVDAIYAAENSENSLANNQNLRAFLSEHISVIAEERFNELTGDQEELDQNRHITFLCPDGSGFVNVNFEPGEPLNLKKLLDTVCERCNSKFSEHKDLIVVGDQFMSPTAK